MKTLATRRVGDRRSVPGFAARVAGAAFLLGFFLPLVTGCHTVRFYAQAIHGQCQVIHRQQSIEGLLARTNTPPELARRLRLVLDIRAFAENQLHLPANGHYLAYADLGRRFAVWNVHAAPEFSLEAKSWWYPVVGRLKYQGYFSESAARRYGATLAARGNDVYVGGVQAYSTLGWFRDPVLNTFAFDSDTDLAELLIHELAHQRLFIPGDTDFNEAFATAVAEEGVRRWLIAEGRQATLAEHEDDARRKAQFLKLLSRARERLESIYARADAACPSSHAALRELKAGVFADLRAEYESLKQSWGGRADYDPWFTQPLNNARLNTMETYYRWIPAFHRLLDRFERRLEPFLEEVGRLAKLGREERAALMERWLAEANASHPGP